MAKILWTLVGTLSLVALAMIIFGGVYYFIGGFEKPISQATVNGETVTSTETSSGGITVNTAYPTINFATTDAQQSGSSVVLASSQESVNGGNWASLTAGTTTATQGQKIDFYLVNGSSYHNAYYGKPLSDNSEINVRQKDVNGNTIIDSILVTSGTFPLTIKLNKNATITENIYTTTGLVMSNGGNGQNQTALGNGATYNFKDEMTASALTSTQDMTCIIEVENGTSLSTSPIGISLSLDGANIPLKSQGKPVYYTSSSGSVLANYYLFDVSPLSTSATRTFTITANSKSTAGLTTLSQIQKACYTKEFFVDPNTGKMTYDVADSNGALKSLAIYKYKFYFQ